MIMLLLFFVVAAVASPVVFAVGVVAKHAAGQHTTPVTNYVYVPGRGS